MRQAKKVGTVFFVKKIFSLFGIENPCEELINLWFSKTNSENKSLKFKIIYEGKVPFLQLEEIVKKNNLPEMYKSYLLEKSNGNHDGCTEIFNQIRKLSPG